MIMKVWRFAGSGLSKIYRIVYDPWECAFKDEGSI